jgi:hypothetical protein
MVTHVYYIEVKGIGHHESMIGKFKVPHHV